MAEPFHGHPQVRISEHKAGHHGEETRQAAAIAVEVW
jgi:hypothetical protein